MSTPERDILGPALCPIPCRTCDTWMDGNRASSTPLCGFVVILPGLATSRLPSARPHVRAAHANGGGQLRTTGAIGGQEDSTE